MPATIVAVEKHLQRAVVACCWYKPLKKSISRYVSVALRRFSDLAMPATIVAVEKHLQRTVVACWYKPHESILSRSVSVVLLLSCAQGGYQERVRTVLARFWFEPAVRLLLDFLLQFGESQQFALLLELEKRTSIYCRT